MFMFLIQIIYNELLFLYDMQTPTTRRTAIKEDGRKRVEIQNVRPNVNCGELPVKRVTGEQVLVTADIISDGHDTISSELLYRKAGEKDWTATRMLHTVNDKWQGVFTVKEVGTLLLYFACMGSIIFIHGSRT